MGTIKNLYEKRHEGMEYLIWLVSFVKPWLPLILLVSVANGFMSVIGVGVAAVNKRVVDAATAMEPRFDGKIFALLVAVMLFNLIFSNGMNVFKTLLNERYGYGAKEQFYGRIMNAKWQMLSRLHSGDLMTRLTGDIDTVASGLFAVIPSAFYIVFQLVTAFLVLYHYDAMLAVVVLVFAPVGLLISVLMSRIFARYQKQSRENESAYRAFLQESVENLVVTKSFTREAYNRKKMRSFWNIRYDIIKKRSAAGFGVGLAMGMIFSGSYLFAFGVSLMRLVNGEITYGTVTLLLTLVGQIQSPVQSLQNLLQQLVAIVVSAGRIKAVWDMPQEESGQEIHLQGKIGVRAEDIDFSYEKGSEQVLTGLNFDVAPGQIVGIVGSSGAGKTTIIRLLLALTEPDRGRVVLYDEQDHEERVCADTRAWISYVPQGNTLVSGSIRDNLLMGKEDATDGEMWQALAVAEAKDFVQGLPLGLDSPILEKGGLISEGQAQRIAIARAVIKTAPVLVLDEATASLDLATEEAIVGNLKRVCGDKTCIVITHRPSLLNICERTLELKNGRF